MVELLDTGADPMNLIWVMPAEGNHTIKTTLLGAAEWFFLWQGAFLISKRITIIANGDPPAAADVARWHRTGDRLIAADGGARHALALGLTPHVVIGDMDSLDADTQAQLARQGCCLITHPPEKDETDLELALLHAAGEGVTEIVLLGALGGRLDQLLANILLLTLPDLAGVRVRLVHGGQEAFVLRGGEQTVIEGQIGDTVSLIPLLGDARGLHTQGLKWPLDGDTLLAGPARGVSNTIVSLPVCIRVEEGMLLVTHHE